VLRQFLAYAILGATVLVLVLVTLRTRYKSSEKVEQRKRRAADRSGKRRRSK